MTGSSPIHGVPGATLDAAAGGGEIPVGPLHPVSVQDLCIRYDGGDGTATTIFEDVDFQVRRGEFLSVIGPSGCGKTSLLRVIGGLQRPQGGAVEVDGRVVAGPVPEAVSFVFQDFALFPWRTARANVEIALELRGVGKRERRQQAQRALERVGLGEAAGRYPAQLSGGMQQRVAIARALVSEAPIMLLDEPFGSLDEQTRLVLGTQLVSLLEDAGRTIVFVTHSLQEAVYLSDRVLVLGGRGSGIREIVDIPLDRPRRPAMLGSAEFQSLQAHLFSLLFESVEGTLSGTPDSEGGS